MYLIPPLSSLPQFVWRHRTEFPQVIRSIEQEQRDSYSSMLLVMHMNVARSGTNVFGGIPS